MVKRFEMKKGMKKAGITERKEIADEGERNRQTTGESLLAANRRKVSW